MCACGRYAGLRLPSTTRHPPYSCHKDCAPLNFGKISATLRELSGAPATHIIYLPRWCHHPPDARVVAYFITLSSWSPPYARPRWCCGISHRNVSSLCLHSAALITAKTTAGATVGMLDVDAILPGGLRYTFDDGGCDHRPDPLALRPCRADLSWRSSSPAGEQSSSS